LKSTGRHSHIAGQAQAARVLAQIRDFIQSAIFAGPTVTAPSSFATFCIGCAGAPIPPERSLHPAATRDSSRNAIHVDILGPRERVAANSEATSMDPIRELKTRAEILHSRLSAESAEDGAALLRLRILPELRRGDRPALEAAAKTIQRKHCLAVVARECGFPSWEHALRALSGDLAETELGTLLYADAGTLNQWFSIYEQARACLDALPAVPRHYLLAYKRDFFIAGSAFITSLGLAPDDPDWEAMGWDWARPLDPAARTRLFGRRLAALRSKP
jgi:hypothetical protein